MRNLLVKPILIVLTGRTFPSISRSNGDFDNWIASGLGEGVEYCCLDARLARELPSPLDFSGVIVSGSHAMVTDRAHWSEQLGQWLKICVETAVPVLGICYGHQLLAHALGGHVDNHPAGIEIGTKSVELLESASRDPLLKGLPKKFPAHLVHCQSVLGLPDGAISLARSEHDLHQAFRFGPCAWGLQFHPEFSTSAMNGYLVETYAIHERRPSE
ncbi:glutamine amidotransferase class-I [Caballeronia pedi]|uniref:Glutamine amidotransferase class-I n=1 Tax=Caballeronia pedi TaxID=1777141 RepID=A0A158BT30_9BURK|nr:glutamine amidotransferase [Caballeronia pedi]SAK72856.1 glutamine amidotransferase class-I [Caballeronia pedi]